MARINFKFADGFDDSYMRRQQQQEDDLLAFQYYVSFISGEARGVYDLHPVYLAQYGHRMPWEVWPEKFGHLKPETGNPGTDNSTINGKSNIDDASTDVSTTNNSNNKLFTSTESENVNKTGLNSLTEDQKNINRVVKYKYYMPKPGETVPDVCAKAGITILELMALNPDKTVNLVYFLPNAIIRLPENALIGTYEIPVPESELIITDAFDTNKELTATDPATDNVTTNSTDENKSVNTGTLNPDETQNKGDQTIKPDASIVAAVSPATSRMDIDIYTPLNEKQLIDYCWEETLAAFKAVNIGIDNINLERWVRKQLRQGWTLGTDAPISLNEYINFVYVDELVFKEPHTVLHVQCWSYNRAYAATAGYKGYWYWVHPVTEKKIKTEGIAPVQKHGAITEYNNKYNTFSEALINELYAVLDDNPPNKDLKDKALASHALGKEFIALVKAVQGKLFGADNKLMVNGAYNEATKAKVKSNAEQKKQDALKKELDASKSHKDTRPVLITKLYFISGDLSLYEKAITEEQANPAAVNQVTLDPPPISPMMPAVLSPTEPAAYTDLLKSAQEVLHEPGTYYPGIPTIATYSAIDAWGTKFKNDEFAMDQERLRLLANRQFAATAKERELLQHQVDNGNTYLQDKLDKLSYNSILNSLRNRVTYTKDAYTSTGNINVGYPTLKPFTDSPGFHSNTPLSNTVRLNPDPVNDMMFAPVRIDPVIYEDVLKGKEQTTLASDIFKTDTNQITLREEVAKATGSYTTDLYTNWKNMFSTFESKYLVDGNFYYGRVRTPEDPLYLAKRYVTEIDNTWTPASEPTYEEDNSWKKEEFKNLLEAVYRELQAKPATAWPDLNKFLLGLYNTLNYYKDNDVIYAINFPGKGITYHYAALSNLATSLYDNTLLQLSKGVKYADNAAVTAFRNQHEQQAKLLGYFSKYGNVKRIPNTFALAQNYSVNINSENRFDASQKTKVQQAVEIDMFWFYDTINMEYVLYVADGANPVELRISLAKGSTNETVAVMMLIKELEENNGLPEGNLRYILPNGSEDSKTFTHHWQWSEVFMWASLVFAIVAMPFTGGTSASWVGFALGALAAGTAIASEVFSMYEKSKLGQLTGTDIITSGLSIFASLLPGMVAVGKLKYLKNVGRFANLENKAFAVTMYTAGITDGVVTGYSLTHDFITGYQNIINSPIDEKEKKLQLERLFLISITYGALTYHSLKGDWKDLKKEIPALGDAHLDPAITQKVGSEDPNSSEYNPEATRNFARQSESLMEAANSPAARINRHGSNAPLPGTVVNPQNDIPRYTPPVAQWSNNAPAPRITEYNVDGVRYGKDDFMRRLTNGEFDSKFDKANIVNGDTDAMDAMNRRKKETGHAGADNDRINDRKEKVTTTNATENTSTTDNNTVDNTNKNTENGVKTEEVTVVKNGLTLDEAVKETTGNWPKEKTDALQADLLANPALFDGIADKKAGIKAWDTVGTARGTNSKFKTDVAVIEKVAALQQDAVFMNRIGGEQGLEDIIRANKRVPSKTYGGGQSHLNSLDDYLADVKNFCDNYNGAENAEEVIKQMKYADFRAVEGNAFMLRYLNETKLPAETIKGFEMKYLDESDFAPDILLKDQTKVDFKSWDVDGSIKKVGQAFYKMPEQLKLYMENPAFKLIFDFNRFRSNPKYANFTKSEALNLIKTEYQKMFLKKADDLFIPKEEGGLFFTKLQIERLFNTSELKIIKMKLNNINNSFYNFIDVQ